MRAMSVLDVLANVFDVPQILSDAGKRRAIATRLLASIDLSDEPERPHSTMLAAAEACVDYVVGLPEDDIDTLLGGYADNREAILGSLPRGPMMEPLDTRMILTAQLIHDLVIYVTKHPRDDGSDRSVS
jgi:hypothetical protein